MSLFKQKINRSLVWKFGLLGGLAEATYCLIIASTIFMIGRVMPEPKSQILSTLLFLLVFVFSATISGVLVLGYPIYLASHQRFFEGLAMALVSLMTLMAAGIIAFLASILIF